MSWNLISGSIGTARAFDNKVGAYVVGETPDPACG